jgi:peptidoglycan/LPS O-acetylase OafA/YrhL
VVLLLSRRSLITVAATMALGSMILRCMLIQSNVSTDEIVASLTPCRLDGLGLGALLAALSRGPQGLGGIAKPAGFIAAGGAMAFVACKLLVHSSGGVWGMSGVGLFAEVLALSGLLALSTAEGTICNQLFTLSPLRFLGKYSYGLYVFHFLLHPWLDAHFWLFPYLPLLSLAAHMVGAVTATLVVALISWHCYERLFLELKHRYDDKAVPESGEEDVKESDPQATFRTIAA